MSDHLEKNFFRNIVSDKRLQGLSGISIKLSELMSAHIGPSCNICQNFTIEHEMITNIYLKSSYFKEAKRLFLYHSTNIEMDMSAILTRGFQEGKKIYMPKVIEKVEAGGRMEFIEVFKDSIYENNQGLLEPVGENYFSPEGLDEIIEMVIPGICFDYKGNRLGYGGAYYDRYIHRFPREAFHITGLAYDYQLFERLPVSEFDVPVDLIITDKNYIDLRNS